MSASIEIGDRHHRPADGLNANVQSENQLVRIVVAEAWASSRAGQLLTTCLVNQLCRQVGIVGHIEIISPDAPLQVSIPGVHEARTLIQGLTALAGWAVNGAVEVETQHTDRPANHTIYVGEIPQGAGAINDNALLVLASGWRAWIGKPKNQPGLPSGLAQSSGSALGPFWAAALAAGEVFKRSRGLTRGRFLEANGYSLWSGIVSPDWNALPDGPAVEGKILPPVHVVGAGAVGNALAYAIANVQLRSAYVVLIDDDAYDTTNLNRCLLAGWDNKGDPKPDIVLAYLRQSGLDGYSFPGTIMAYVGTANPGLQADVASRVGDLDFDIVVSCVDKGASRQDVQGLRPHLLMGASTLDLQAKTNVYGTRPGSVCLACYNPKERDGEKIRALESQLRNMAVGDRAAFLTSRGLDVAAIEEYLSGAKCGGAGEAAIRDFAIKPPADFSVGFVSLGAGLLVTASLIRMACFGGPCRSDMTTFNFLNGGMVDAGLGADPTCQLKCCPEG